MPKFNFLYFKNLLDIAFIKFFDLYNDSFKKIGDTYVLIDNININTLINIFKLLIQNEIDSIIINKFDVLNPEYYLIIGSCMPHENILYELTDKKEFPIKLKSLIESDYKIKYLLKEKDIKIDTVLFNQVMIEIFNYYFQNKHDLNNRNIYFIQHNRLDCYMIFKTLKAFFGNKNCKNLFIERYKNINLPIIAINELIDRYSNCKKTLKTNQEFKNSILEIKNYLQFIKII